MFKKIILIGVLVGSLYASVEEEVDAYRFEHKNGTLIDHFSAMQWQDDEYIESKSNRKNWKDAQNYCSKLVLDGKNDWRLPNIAEIEYIYNMKTNFNYLDYNGHYWSDTSSFLYRPDTFWYMTFIGGYRSREFGSWHINVCCIRGKSYQTLSILQTTVQNVRTNKIKQYNQNILKYLKKVKDTNSIQEYKNFIKKFPNSTYIEEIKQYLALLEYEPVKDKNNIAGYEWFIKTYPKAPQVKDAIANIHKLAFDKAEDIDTISAYNTFIISYPMAKEVSQANKLAKELEIYKYTDTLPAWFRSIMPDFLADIFNGIFGIFSSDEKKSRALLIKAKQIERQGNEQYGDKKAGYVMITNRMYDLLQEEYDDTDATLRFLESEEFKDFVRTFKRVMSSMNDRLNDISRYSSEILEVSKQGFSEANADRDMSEYYAQQHRKWEKNMHLRDKGYQ